MDPRIDPDRAAAYDRLTEQQIDDTVWGGQPIAYINGEYLVGDEVPEDQSW